MKKKGVPTDNILELPIAENDILPGVLALSSGAAFWSSGLGFFVILSLEERLITPHFRGDLLLENVYPQIHL